MVRMCGKVGIVVGLFFLLGMGNVQGSGLLDRVYEELTEDYEDRLEKVEEVEDEMERNRDAYEEVKKELESIKTNIRVTEGEITEKEEEIADTEKEMDRLLGEMMETERELDERSEEFVRRIQSTSRGRVGDLFTTVFTSGSFTEMVDSLNKVRKVLRSDNDVIEEYLDLKDLLSDQREQEERLLSQLEETRVELGDLRVSLKGDERETEIEKQLMDMDHRELVDRYRELKASVSEVEWIYEDVKALKQVYDRGGYWLGHQTGDYQLNPVLEYLRLSLVNEAKDRGIRIETTEGYRSWDRQNYLFNIGRGEADERGIVTNARGGQSFHNFSLAFDIVIVDQWGNYQWEGNVDTNGSGKSDWEEVGEIGKSLGLDWGGDFEKILDMPHYEYTFGRSLSDLRRLR